MTSFESCFDLAPGVPDCAATYEAITSYLRARGRNRSGGDCYYDAWKLRVPVQDSTDFINISLQFHDQVRTCAFQCRVEYHTKVAEEMKVIVLSKSEQRDLRTLLLNAMHITKPVSKHGLCLCFVPFYKALGQKEKWPWSGQRGSSLCWSCGGGPRPWCCSDPELVPADTLALIEAARLAKMPKIVKATPIAKCGPASFNPYDHGNIHRCLTKRAKPSMIGEARRSCLCAFCLYELAQLPANSRFFSREPAVNPHRYTSEERARLIKENPRLLRGLFPDREGGNGDDIVERELRADVKWFNSWTGTGDT